jgi:hypothetical protein
VLHARRWQPEFSFYVYENKKYDNNKYNTEAECFFEPNSSSATQEIPGILRIWKIHCRINKSPPLVSTPSQVNPIHCPPSISLRCIKYNNNNNNNNNNKRESKKLSALLFFQFIYTKVGVEQVRHFST